MMLLTDGHEHDGEERADVEQGEDIAQAARPAPGQQDAEGEEDVAADGVAASGADFEVGVRVVRAGVLRAMAEA